MSKIKSKEKNAKHIDLKEMKEQIYAGYLYNMDVLGEAYTIITGKPFDYTIKRFDIHRLICNYDCD